MHAKNARKPIRNDKNICFRRPSLTSSSSALLRHWLEFAFAWENRPRPDGIFLCVAAPATQVAIPSGRRPWPDGIRLCVAPAATQLQKSSDPSRETHATANPSRPTYAVVAPSSSRRGKTQRTSPAPLSATRPEQAHHFHYARPSRTYALTTITRSPAQAGRMV